MKNTKLLVVVAESRLKAKAGKAQSHRVIACERHFHARASKRSLAKGR